MRLIFNGRPIEVTAFKFTEGQFYILSAVYSDDDRELTDEEMDELQDEGYDELYEAMPKGTSH